MSPEAIAPGQVVTIREAEPDASCLLQRTPSVYEYGESLQLHAVAGARYVVCQGDGERGFPLCLFDHPSTPIGFCLILVDGRPHTKITQVGFQAVPAEVVVVGSTDNPPRGRRVGSQVWMCRGGEAPTGQCMW